MSTKLPPQMATADPTIHAPRQRRASLIAVCIALMAVIASVSGLNAAQQKVAWSGRRGSNSRPVPWQGTALIVYSAGVENGT
jgi:hypothetical protein